MHTNMAIRSAICGTVVALLVASPFSTASAKWLAKNNPRLPVGVYFQGMQGSVVLSLILDKSGRVTDTECSEAADIPLWMSWPVMRRLIGASARTRCCPPISPKGESSWSTSGTQILRKRSSPDAKPYWAQLKG